MNTAYELHHHGATHTEGKVGMAIIEKLTAQVDPGALTRA